MGWALLDARERRNARIVVIVVIISALSSSLMVASIMPFLSVLADPGKIEEIGVLARLYAWGGFSTPRQFLVALGLGSIAVILVANVIQILRVYVVTRYAFMRAHTISYRLLSRLLRQPYSYFLQQHSGDMGTVVLSESQQVVAQFFRPALELFAALATIIALVGLLLYVNPVVSMSAFAVLGLIYGGALVMSRRAVWRMGNERARANTARFRIANEALGGIRDIRLLGRERTYLDRYHAPSLKMSQALAYVTAIGQIPQYVMHAAAFAGLIVLCLVLMAGPDGQGGTLAELLPTIGLLAFAGQRMLPEMSKLYQNLTQLTSSDAAVRAVYRDMTTATGNIDLPPRAPVPPLGLKHEIVFDNVTYRYDGGGKAGLTDVSFRIAAGERIGVVGSTGAGKSTLANILLGLLDPTEGCVSVDGTEIGPDTMRRWQRSIGYVPQEIFLTDASVRENIALGVPPDQIDDAQVRRAAEIAHIHDFVTSDLDQGYDTLVGERGVRLSGGQRQRIGIARALYENADFILLDEATSALDNQTEAEVMQAIESLPGDKTIVMIAHRLTTLRNCDRILMLEQGKAVGFSSWELLEENQTVSSTFAKMSGSI